MIVRIVLFALILTGIGGFGSIAYVMLTDQSATAAAVAAAPALAKRTVVTVNKGLKPGSLLKPEDLGSEELTLDKVPNGAVPDGDDVKRSLVGGLVRHALSANDVLRLPEDALRPTDHGFLAAVLAPGTRAVTVGVDTVSGAAGLIWPGDRVDVILTQSMDDQGVAPGRRVAAETMLQDVRVIAIDQQITQGGSGSDSASVAKTVTLEVRPEKVEVVQVGAKLGRLSLSLRAADAGAVRPHPAADRLGRRCLGRLATAGRKSRSAAPPPSTCSKVPQTARSIVSDAPLLRPAGHQPHHPCLDPQRPRASQPRSRRLARPGRRTRRTRFRWRPGRGRVLTLSGAAANIFVADPKVAEVRPASSTSLFIFGVGPGHTTVAAMDSNGQVIGQYTT